jgi:hypothetical protein
MGQREVPQPPRFRSWLRGLWPDRNPLRRTCDRAEAAVVAALAAALLIAVPLAALSVGLCSYSAGVRAEHAQAAWRQVPAVLIADATDVAPAGPGTWQPRVLASWTAPDGTQRAGRIPAPVNARAGTTLTVWVDPLGQLTGIPLGDHQVERQALLAALLTSAGLAMALLGAGALARRLLDRRRLAAWDAAWQATGPDGPPHTDVRVKTTGRRPGPDSSSTSLTAHAPAPPAAASSGTSRTCANCLENRTLILVRLMAPEPNPAILRWSAWPNALPAICSGLAISTWPMSATPGWLVAAPARNVLGPRPRWAESTNTPRSQANLAQPVTSRAKPARAPSAAYSPAPASARPRGS